MASKAEDFRTLYCDPGEDFGFCWGKGFKLLGAGIEKMWPFADEVWAALNDEPSVLSGDTAYLRGGVTAADNTGPIKRIVCEDFRIYPWKANELKFNPVRTARVIGALQMMCRIKGLEFVLQPASIKKAAVAAGAEQFFYHPLYENRHANDAIMHFAFYTNTEMMGRKIDVPNDGADEVEA